MNVLSYIIKLNDQMSAALKKVGISVDSTSKKTGQLNRSVNTLNKTGLDGFASNATNALKSIPFFQYLFNPVTIATAGIVALNKTISTSTAAYNAQSEAENKLAQVMRNTMNARGEYIESILKLAAVQQKLGVVGDEIQLSGAQELATYLTKKSSLEKLLPAMNDMLAQQYGLNASQEQAQNIASMLGKVMDGQVGALSRYGYKFDEVQEHILKTGTEAQRATVLFDVVNSAVGGVNAALAATPEGRWKQISNNLGDTQERLGKFITNIKLAFLPVYELFLNLSNRILAFFERNQSKIQQIMAVISHVVTGVMNTVFGVFKWLYDMFMQYQTPILAIIGAFLTYKAALVSVAVVTKTLGTVIAVFGTILKAMRIATLSWAAALKVLNTVFYISPIGLIVSAVLALIAGIALLIYKIEGLGKTWGNVIRLAQLSFMWFRFAVEYGWLEIQDVFFTGIESIEKKWYQLQELLGETGAAKKIQEIEIRQKLREDTKNGVKDEMDGFKKAITELKVFELSWNNKGFSDILSGIKNKLGIEAPTIPGSDFDAFGGSNFNGSDSGSSDVGGETASAIATGGTKTTNITINLGQLVDTITINQNSTQESAEDMRDIILDELTRVLSMAQGNV